MKAINAKISSCVLGVKILSEALQFLRWKALVFIQWGLRHVHTASDAAEGKVYKLTDYIRSSKYDERSNALVEDKTSVEHTGSGAALHVTDGSPIIQQIAFLK